MRISHAHHFIFFNARRHRSYVEYYDDATRAKVAEDYAHEIERFGYTF